MAKLSQIQLGTTLYDVGAKWENISEKPNNFLPYGVCGTAADTAAKTVTISNLDNFVLETGAIVAVKFTNASGIASPTLNVNDTGAKPITRYGTTAASTGTSTTGWRAGAVQIFVYDGTSWIRDFWENTTYSNVSLGQGYATCSTAEATTAKTASLSSYALSTGGIVAVKFTNAVPASATLNINSKGAKAIYHKGAAIKAGVIKAGDTATFIYSTQYHLLSVDRDDNTVYTHPTTTGNKHIPSGGSSGQILRWSADGTATWGADNNTTYTAGTGISISTANAISNSGVRSISTGTSNGTISVNTNGTSVNVSVKGLGSAAYTASTAYDAAGAANTAESNAKSYTDTAIANLVDSAPSTLNTLNELAAALGDDKNFATTVANNIADKVSKSETGVQTIAGGLVIGATSTSGLSGTGKGRIMFTGQTNPLIGLQAVDANNNLKTPYFIQSVASDDKLYIGPTSAKALSFDSEGNMISPANLSVGGTISEGGTLLSAKYAAKSHGTHVSYGTSATAVGKTAAAGTASTVSRSDHTHSLSKSAVTTALGYTPPTTDTNTAHSHSAGVGLTGSGNAGTSGTYTYKVNLVNEAVASNAASYTAGGTSKFYAVQLDKNNKLGVYVPWTDNNTTYTFTNKATTLAWGTQSTIATIGGVDITVTMPANPNTNTHYTTGITAGATGTTSNSATTNGNTFIKIKDDSTHRGQVKIVGSGATTVTSDANGVITISSTDNNTVYTHPTSAGNKHIPSGGSSGQILRWSAAGTATWGADNDTNYYHTRVYSSGLKISTGTGVSDMYVPSATGSQSGVVIMHPAASCTTFTSDDSTCTVAAVKKAVTLFTNDYAPTKTGGGASGTWGISITGNAATATTASSCSGNAATATKLKNARTISLTGSVTGSGTFDGSGNLSIATTTNHTHSYLPLSGGTMTGNISYQGSKATYAMIKWIDNSNDTYGNGIEIGGGGAVVIGGGESASAMRGTLGSGGDEVLYLCNDGGIDFYTNVQNGASTAIHTYITGAGESHWVKCHGAVWNDYAEYRICNEDFKPGQVVLENGDDTLSIANQRLQRGCSIVSDTFGFAIGETDEAKCPIAVSGRVLAYGYESREEFKKHIGWPVCSGPNGTVSIMSEEEEEKYPSRIIGIISAVPEYETWGSGNTIVDNRIWIKVK